MKDPTGTIGWGCCNGTVVEAILVTWGETALDGGSDMGRGSTSRIGGRGPVVHLVSFLVAAEAIIPPIAPAAPAKAAVSTAVAGYEVAEP